jgi:hypothetical protein
MQTVTGRVEDVTMRPVERLGLEGLTTSQRLRQEHRDVYDRAQKHPVVKAVADVDWAPDVFDRLLVINSFFLRTYRRFLQVMGTLAPHPRASALLFEGLRGVDVELARTASYVMASVGEGWWRGLAVAFSCETVFHHAWRGVTDFVPAQSTRGLFLLSWGPDSDRFVSGLATEMDRLSWTPELSRVVAHVAELEMASWDEALLDPGESS